MMAFKKYLQVIVFFPLLWFSFRNNNIHSSFLFKFLLFVFIFPSWWILYKHFFFFFIIMLFPQLGFLFSFPCRIMLIVLGKKKYLMKMQCNRLFISKVMSGNWGSIWRIRSFSRLFIFEISNRLERNFFLWPCGNIFRVFLLEFALKSLGGIFFFFFFRPNYYQKQPENSCTLNKQRTIFFS